MVDDVVQVYVGADKTQHLAVSVLEHSIGRFSSLPVEVHEMLDLPVQEPIDPRQGQRTGFSYSRFCVPKLAGYQGKAIYLDPDMLVFGDIAELWNLPFEGAKVIIQEEVKFQEKTTNKEGAPKKRAKQCSVMIIDCERVDWDIENIVEAFDNCQYTYEDLMYDLCILEENDIKFGVPFEWNSLEHFDKDTRLIHYTDVYTQPWTSHKNKNGYLWFNEVRLMLRNGGLCSSDLGRGIDLGYFRPSLMRDIKYGHLVPKTLQPIFQRYNAMLDKTSKYIPHKEVYEAKRRRKKLIKAYEEKLKLEQKRSVAR